MARPPSLRLTAPVSGSARDHVLAFVQARFLERYGARVPDDSPLMAGAFDADGALVAAFGLRDSAAGFFCERYLGEPLEEPLGRQFGRPVDRGEIVEITHLCAARPGSLRLLMTVVPGLLTAHGYRYLVCTATACLAVYFQRRGLSAVCLGLASADALPAAERALWGTYYDAAPRVLAGDLQQAAGALGLTTERPHGA